MKKTLALVTLSLFASFTFAQIYWSENAAQVFYDNCTSCHNANGIGPFALLDYENAFIHKDAIKYVVEDNEMPPWTADTSYQSYFHERVLSEDERAIIINWVNDGALEGNPAAAPPPPVYNNEQVISGIPDLVVEMPLYMSKATASSDDYICIALPTGLST